MLAVGLVTSGLVVVAGLVLVVGLVVASTGFLANLPRSSLATECCLPSFHVSTFVFTFVAGLLAAEFVEDGFTATGLLVVVVAGFVTAGLVEVEGLTLAVFGAVV